MHSRAAAAAATSTVLLLSLAACGPATSHDDAKPSTGSTAGPPDGKAGKGVPLSSAINNLKAADEHRTGYERDKFRLWDDADHDGCDTCIICTLRSGYSGEPAGRAIP